MRGVGFVMFAGVQHSARADSGASAVEFALVLLPLLFIVFGIIDYGRAFYVQVNLESATREIARQWAVAGASPATSGGIIEARNRVADLQSLSDVSDGSVAPTWSFAPGATDPVACTTVGQPLTASVAIPFSMVLPLLPGPSQLQAATTMRCERT